MTTFATYSAASIRAFQPGSGELKYRQTLDAPNPTLNGTFGHVVAMSTDGTYLLATEPYIVTLTGTRTPQAHIYTQNQNTLEYEFQSTLTPSSNNRAFGYSGDINQYGNVVVGGDVFANVSANSGAGSATVFTRSGNTWTQLQTLTANTPITNEAFGYSSAISHSGNYIVVGSFSTNKNVYVFTKSGNTYVQQAKLNPGDIGTGGGNGFGYSVTINPNENFIAVGAINDTNSRGAVYLYNRSGNTWSQVDKITPSSANNSFVGSSVKIEDDGSGNALLLYMGATGSGGTVYYSIGPYWTTTYTGATGVGRSIDVSQTYGGNTGGYNRVIYGGNEVAKTNSNWQFGGTLYNLVPGNVNLAGTEYGTSVTISETGYQAAVGAPYANVGNAYIGIDEKAGSVYIFTIY